MSMPRMRAWWSELLPRVGLAPRRERHVHFQEHFLLTHNLKRYLLLARIPSGLV